MAAECVYMCVCIYGAMLRKRCDRFMIRWGDLLVGLMRPSAFDLLLDVHGFSGSGQCSNCQCIWLGTGSIEVSAGRIASLWRRGILICTIRVYGMGHKFAALGKISNVIYIYTCMRINMMCFVLCCSPLLKMLRRTATHGVASVFCNTDGSSRWQECVLNKTARGLWMF